GNLVMRTCGRWCIAGSHEAHFETYDLQYQPHRAGPLKTVAGTDGWGISSSSKVPDQAWEVVKLLSGPDAAIDMVQLGGNIPALRSVAEMSIFAESGPPNSAIFYESLDYAATVPSPRNFNVIEPILNRHYATIWNGERGVEEALIAAHEELQAEMDKLQAAYLHTSTHVLRTAVSIHIGCCFQSASTIGSRHERKRIDQAARAASSRKSC